MSNLYVQETYLNATEGHMIGESDVYETYTDHRGELFREMQHEYGRCVGKVYVDTDHGTRAIGWVFQGRDKYQDANETYVREVWVTVHRDKPVKTVSYSYDEVPA